jgi:hypothetical protein
MDANIGLALLGLAVTVIFGLIGARAARKRKQNQRQNAERGSNAIQSGRDTNIGNKQ